MTLIKQPNTIQANDNKKVVYAFATTMASYSGSNTTTSSSRKPSSRLHDYTNIEEELDRLGVAPNKHVEDELSKERNTTTLPEQFLCDLTHEIMEHPVLTVYNNKFERDAIQEWLQANDEICPITGKPLTVYDLVPNDALREKIQSWLEEKQQQEVLYVAATNSSTASIPSSHRYHQQQQPYASLPSSSPKQEHYHRKAIYDDAEELEDVFDYVCDDESDIDNYNDEYEDGEDILRSLDIPRVIYIPNREVLGFLADTPGLVGAIRWATSTKNLLPKKDNNTHDDDLDNVELYLVPPKLNNRLALQRIFSSKAA